MEISYFFLDPIEYIDNGGNVKYKIRVSDGKFYCPGRESIRIFGGNVWHALISGGIIPNDNYAISDFIEKSSSKNKRNKEKVNVKSLTKLYDIIDHTPFERGDSVIPLMHGNGFHPVGGDEEKYFVSDGDHITPVDQAVMKNYVVNINRPDAEFLAKLFSREYDGYQISSPWTQLKIKYKKMHDVYHDFGHFLKLSPSIDNLLHTGCTWNKSAIVNFSNSGFEVLGITSRISRGLSREKLKIDLTPAYYHSNMIGCILEKITTDKPK